MEENNKATHQPKNDKELKQIYQKMLILNQFCIKNKIIPQCEFSLKEMVLIMQCFDEISFEPKIIQYIYKSSSIYIFKSFNKDSILKYLIILIFYIFFMISKPELNSYLNHLIRIIAKLHRDCLFSINEIVSIGKLLLILGLHFNKEEHYKTDSIEKLNLLMINSRMIINAFSLIHESFQSKQILSNEEIKGINSFIDYFNDYVLSNFANCIMLSKSFDHFPLLSLIKKQALELNNTALIHLLSEKLQRTYIHLFKFNFNNKLLKNMINAFKSILINFERKSDQILIGELDLANIQIDYLKNCNIIEDNNLKEDISQFPNGFFFHEKRKNVFKINIKTLPELSIIFGFKSRIDLSSQNEKKCLMFFANCALEPFISLIIDNKKLKLEIHPKDKRKQTLETFHTNITIQPNVSYVLIFQFAYNKYSKAMQIKILTSDKQQTETKISNLGKEINADCYIGCFYAKLNNKNKQEMKFANRFTGEIGTVIFLSKVLTNYQEKMLLSLKGYYELGLFYGRFDMRNFKKYLENSLYAEQMDNESINGLTQSIYIVVSPLNFQLSEKGAIDRFVIKKHKLFYQNSYLRNDKNNNMFNQRTKFEIIDSVDTNRIILIQRKRTVDEFFRYNGLGFLTLHLEYYYQLLKSFSEKNTFDPIENGNSIQQLPNEKQASKTNLNRDVIITKVYTNIDNILFFLTNVWCDCNLKNYLTELKPFFFTLSITLDELVNYRKINREKIYISLMKMFIIFKLDICLLNDKFEGENQNNAEEIRVYTKKLNEIIKFRACFAYFLFNKKLYDWDDFTTLIDLFDTFAKNIPYQQTELINKTMLQRILTFIPMVLIRNNNSNGIYIKNNGNKIIGNQEQSDLLKKSYIELIIAFITHDQNNTCGNNNKLLDEFFNYLNHSSTEEEFYEIISLLYLNPGILNKIKDLSPIKDILAQKSKHYSDKTLIIIILLYIDLHTNSLYTQQQKGEEFGCIDTFILQIKETTQYSIKAILISLYNSQLTNEEKLYYTFELLEFPLQKEGKPLIFEPIVSCILLKNCVYLITNMPCNDDSDELFVVTKVLADFIKIILNLPNNDQLFNDFFNQSNDRILYYLYKTNAKYAHISQLIEDTIPSLITRHRNPFIFQFLFDLSKENPYEKFVMKLIQIIITQLRSIMVLNHRYFIYNLANFILYLYKEVKDSSQSVFKFSQMKNEFYSIIELIAKSNLVSVKTLFTIQNGEKKIMSEILIEIFFVIIVSDSPVFDSLKEEEKLLQYFNRLFFISHNRPSEIVFYQMDILKMKSITFDEKETNAIENEYFNNEPMIVCSVFVNCFIIILNILGQEKSVTPSDELLSICEKMYSSANMLFLGKNENHFQKRFALNQKTVPSDEYAFVSNYLHQINSTFKDMSLAYNKYKKKNEELTSKFIRDQSRKSSSISINNSLSVHKKQSSFLIRRQLKAMSLSISKSLFDRTNSVISFPNEDYNIDDIIHFQHIQYDGVITNPKKYFLMKHFGLYFKDVFFYNETFVDMKTYFISNFDCNRSTKQLNYPSKRKKYAHDIYPPIFIKQDSRFFINNDYFPISHKYYSEKVLLMKEQRIDFKRHSVRANDSNTLIASYFCEMIAVNYIVFGVIEVYNDYMVFHTNVSDSEKQNYNKKDEKYLFSSLPVDRKVIDKECVFYYKQIKEILSRRFLLMWQGIELFLSNGHSYFFNMFHSDYSKSFWRIVNERKKNFNWKLVENCQMHFREADYTGRWLDNQIDTYDYLLILNKYSSRTFNDSSQYYVFPWVVLSYNDNDNKLNPSNLRNFNRLISIQTDDKLNKLKAKVCNVSYDTFLRKSSGHYSTSSFVLLYLMRQNPFTQELFRLQNMAIENPCRVFNNFEELLQIIKENDQNRELIPECYSSIEFMLNLNCDNYGKRNINDQVDDIVFSNGTIAKYVAFIILQMKLLSHPSIRENIHNWIDNIFGKNQINQKDPSFSVSQTSYEQITNYEEIKKKQIEQKIPLKEIQREIILESHMVINFGQTPHQLLLNTHPRWIPDKDDQHQNINDSYDIVSNIIHSKSIELPNINRAMYFTQIENFLVVLTIKKTLEVIDIENTDKNKVLFKLEPNRFKYQYKINSRIDSEEKTPLFKPKYVFCVLNTKQSPDEWLFVVGRYLDNSIKIYKGKNEKAKEQDLEPYEVLTENFVCCIAKIDDWSLFSGLRNGKLIKWKIIPDKSKRKDQLPYRLIQNKYVLAHEAEVNVIAIDKKNGTVITSGADNTILIRALYDFELLTVIHESPFYITTDILVSPMNFIYSMAYDPISNMSIINGYTMTGIKFASSELMPYNSICFSDGYRILVNKKKETNIFILSPSSLDEVDKVFDKEKMGDINLFSYHKNVVYLSGLNTRITKVEINNEKLTER